MSRGETSAEQERAYLQGLESALDAGYALLENGGSSLDDQVGRTAVGLGAIGTSEAATSAMAPAVMATASYASDDRRGNHLVTIREERVQHRSRVLAFDHGEHVPEADALVGQPVRLSSILVDIDRLQVEEFLLQRKSAQAMRIAG